MPRNFLECKTFEELERSASIKELTPQEQAAYDHSLKVLRDNYYIADHERKQGRIEGRIEGINEARTQIVKNLIGLGLETKDIAKAAEISEEEVLKIMGSLN